MFDITAGRLTSKSAKSTVIVFAEDKAKLVAAGSLVDESLDGAIVAGLKGTRFQGSSGQIKVLAGVSGGKIDQVVVVGLGKIAKMDNAAWYKIGADIGRQLDALGVREASIALGEDGGKADLEMAGQMLLEGVHVAMYRFDRYKTEMKPHQLPKFKKMNLLTSGRAARLLNAQVDALQALFAGQDLTRDLVNLPANEANPQYMVEEAKELEKLGIKLEVFDEKQLTKMGMNLFMAVGGGAAQKDQPRMLVMKYQGAGKDEPYRAIVGKGLMFDTGGYNIKPTGYMETMKCDMGGAAVVMGLMRTLAERKPKINVIGVCGCAMNMVSAEAFLPGTIYKSYKGLTVEIGNTDAEGRLVLADCLAYVVEKEKPKEVIDLATLTGAIMVALGAQYAGLFSNNDRLANALHKSGGDVGERLWRMPTDSAFAAKTELADLNNDGNRYGGSSTAAVFLERFVDNTPWAHLDIAGVTLNEKIPSPVAVKGATGYGVRLLLNYLEGEAAAATATPARKRRGRKRR